MAFRFNELPWYVQILLYAVVAVGIFLAGEYLDFSPVKQKADERVRLQRELNELTSKVNELQGIKQQHQMFLTKLEAMDDQLKRLQAFVPEKKSTDEFMRTLQAESSGAQVALRSLKSRAVVVRGQIAEMPFEVELDGGYYDVSDFFDRLGQKHRIINASALTLSRRHHGSRHMHRDDFLHAFPG
jgi:type IV pilus assembly protein PilO